MGTFVVLPSFSNTMPSRVISVTVPPATSSPASTWVVPPWTSSRKATKASPCWEIPVRTVYRSGRGVGVLTMVTGALRHQQAAVLHRDPEDATRAKRHYRAPPVELRPTPSGVPPPRTASRIAGLRGQPRWLRSCQKTTRGVPSRVSIAAR